MDYPPIWTPAPGVTLYNADCIEVLPTLAGLDAVITDPPYGMGKAGWDLEIPNWLSAAGQLPVATFCGVVGMRDYPTPDWIGAWVRLASTQRNGKLQGFNNWEPILFYRISRLANDVFIAPNIHDDHGHPTEKPLPLMLALIQRLGQYQCICDPFMGSGTTILACIRTGRRAIGIERDPGHYQAACARVAAELQQPFLLAPIQAALV